MLELSYYLLDLIENSIAAEASSIFLNIVEDLKKDLFSLEVVDDGWGLDAEEIEKICDPFVTSRRLRNVGLGLPLLRDAAIFCGGDLFIQSEKGKGTVVKATFQHSHIDRVPLGDVASTIMSAVAAKPDINLRYWHQINGKEFIFDTSGLVSKFPGAVFSEVRVLSWIESFCQEGIEKLYVPG